MKSSAEHATLVELINWISDHIAGLELPADERSMLSQGCFSIAVEHQHAIAVLYESQLSGSMLALLRVLYESLVRGLWLYECATDAELEEFKKNGFDKKNKKTIFSLIQEYESKIETPNGVLSKLQKSARKQMNDFTHTGFMQISRRHAPGLLGPNYSESELSEALRIAGALGLIAAGELITMANRQDLLPSFMERMSTYAKPVA